MQNQIVAHSTFGRFSAVAIAVIVIAAAAHTEAGAPADGAPSSEAVDPGDDPDPDAPTLDRVLRDVLRAGGIATGAIAADPLRLDSRAIDRTALPFGGAAGRVQAAAVDQILDERVAAGRHWRLETARGAVHVWVPADYDAATAATIVFVHGYWVNVDEAWASYRLAQQFALSGVNAMFIVPEAPAAKWRPLAWPSLAELIHAVASGIDVAMPSKRLVAIGHSGAYRTLSMWLANPLLDTIVLLDAVYAEYSFAPWVRASKQRRLVNIVYETGRFSDYLHRQLPGTKRVEGLPLEGLPESRILYVRTHIGHWQLVTGGVALPLALRAIGVPSVASAPTDLPLGLPQRDDPALTDGLVHPPFGRWMPELAP